jgi:predicted nucleic acid-binding Zn ribbon protein
MERAAKLLRQWKLASGHVSSDQVAIAAWSVAAGKKIAAHSRAVNLVRGRLVVEVSDEIWQKQLRSVRGFILSKLEKDLGEPLVTDIEFRVVPLRRGPAREERVVRGPLFPAGPDEADAIGDPFMALVYKAKRKRSTA